MKLKEGKVKPQKCIFCQTVINQPPFFQYEQKDYIKQIGVMLYYLHLSCAISLYDALGKDLKQDGVL